MHQMLIGIEKAGVFKSNEYHCYNWIDKFKDVEDFENEHFHNWFVSYLHVMPIDVTIEPRNKYHDKTVRLISKSWQGTYFQMINVDSVIFFGIKVSLA